MTKAKSVRHFLSLADLTSAELKALVARAIELKQLHRQGVDPQSMRGRILGMVFEKSSTRTRVSFAKSAVPFAAHAVSVGAVA